ncbi:hypothetical protein [Micromonospora sp. NPDC023888]|uniref:hypothetical protein n=1 Tax=Micromonospora sp. NPDC023888 TaxID=3155607 RepID=UPI0033D8D7DE
MWKALRSLAHAEFGWDDIVGMALVVYYGLDIAPPKSEADTGRVLAARMAGTGVLGRPLSVATVRRYLRTAEEALARRAGWRASLGVAGAARMRTAVQGVEFGALVATLPPPPWGALERRLAHGLLHLYLRADTPGEVAGAAQRARKSRALRTAEANLAVARAVLTYTEPSWPRTTVASHAQTRDEAPTTMDSALRGHGTLDAYEGLLNLCRRALSSDGLMAPVWLERAAALRARLGAALDSDQGRRLVTIESWYRGQLAYDYQDIGALGRHPRPGSARLRRLTPLGRADGFRTSSTHAAMIFETRVLAAHGYFAEALAAVQQRRTELVRGGIRREGDADTTWHARLKSRLMANQAELEILVLQLERPTGLPQTSDTRGLYRHAEGLVEAIMEDSLELADDFGYSHFAAVAVRFYLAVASRATTQRRRRAMLANAHRVLDREPLYAPCPCGCTASSNGAVLRVSVAERDDRVIREELLVAGRRARQVHYFDGEIMDLLLLHRQARRIVDLPDLTLDSKLLRPRPGSPARHHAAWLHLVGGDAR